jgi:hypothetical protein
MMHEYLEYGLGNLQDPGLEAELDRRVPGLQLQLCTNSSSDLFKIQSSTITETEASGKSI